MALYALALLFLFRSRRPALGPLVGAAIALSLMGLAWYIGLTEAARPHVDRWIAHDPRWDRQCHTHGGLVFVAVATLIPLGAVWAARGRTRDRLDQAIVLGIASVVAFLAAMFATLFVSIQHLACDTL